MKVIDLFCGAGGFSKGFEQEGFEIVLGIDNWAAATENFKLNHPNAEVWTKDIAEIDVKDLPEADVIIGGTPCQEFTSLNLKKQPWRGMINVCHFMRVVYKYKPKYWIMENVLGLNKYLPPHLDRFKLRASDFGCKTGRRRLFVGNTPEPKVNPDDVNPNPARTSVGIDNRNKINTPVFDVEGLKFEGTKKEIKQLQVNCVPPRLARCLAKAIG